MLKNHLRVYWLRFFSIWEKGSALYNDGYSRPLFTRQSTVCRLTRQENLQLVLFQYICSGACRGILADSTKKYKLVILAGIIIMFAGYLIMAVPGMSLTVTIIGLMTIALGNGLFKGNLQAVVGQLYDDPNTPG